MDMNASLSTISTSIMALSHYAGQLGLKYVIDSPVVALSEESFVRIGRFRDGAKTLLYSSKTSDEQPLSEAPIMAKVAFLKLFENFFETYATHAEQFWADVDYVIQKCSGCVDAAMERVRSVQEEERFA